MENKPVAKDRKHGSPILNIVELKWTKKGLLIHNSIITKFLIQFKAPTYVPHIFQLNEKCMLSKQRQKEERK
jgi:hypothetical protein